MTNLADAKRSIEPFLQRVRAWDWQVDPAASPQAGIVLPIEDWLQSLAVERWQPLRIRWRNWMVDPMNATDIDADDWNVLVRHVRGELQRLLDVLLGPSVIAEVRDSVRWDVLGAWQATALAVRSPYVTMLDLYSAGWLVGGPVGGETVDDLAVIPANRVASPRE